MALEGRASTHLGPSLTRTPRRVMGAWRERPIPDHAWRTHLGQSRRASQEEQDEAAGSRHARTLITRSGGRALARVSFRVRRGTRRAYAYLLWDYASTRHEMLLGEATHSTRRDNLSAAWALIHQHSLLKEEGRRAWPRKVTPPE